jgi:hypothetical protein
MSPSIFPKITNPLEVGRRKVFIGNSKTSKEYFMHQHLCLRETFSPDSSWLAGAKFGASNTALLVASANDEELVVGECLSSLGE